MEIENSTMNMARRDIAKIAAGLLFGVGLLSTRTEAISKAMHDLKKEAVLYCVRREGSQGVGFYVLGKDGNGNLLNGFIRGTSQQPFVISPGDAEGTE